jgi:hypothetical protein
VHYSLQLFLQCLGKIVFDEMDNNIFSVNGPRCLISYIKEDA